ncbi:hypothetical protein DQ04_00851040 [Trypanosoma grayi]|uniref:hypothetical protein n=1 Tax=Trypanosoma grayi TaxID=71804 RepID=UPI0004F491B7|nr:hypothetical protein DQ04_00851040 [Trypanosoma grayi]KEG13678.1 hypothetical protein DQ04_00851040 [Trypanosoma grayi]
MSMEEKGEAPSSSSNDALSAEEELKRLREKTSAWKQSVAVQLNEAAKKNKQLRDELKAASVSHEAELAAMRVQLDKEFRERTILKDEEIQELQRLITNLREEKRRMAEQHEKDVEQTATRIRENCQMERDTQWEAELAQRDAEVRELRDTVERKEKTIQQSDHEVAVMNARLERLGEQYKELSALMTNDAGQIVSDATGPSSSPAYQQVLKVSDAAHQQQLETARSELRNLEEKHAGKLREAQRTFEVERQRWMDDLYRRDEQLATLQTLLRQAQHEAATAQQRIAGVLAEKERSEQRLAEKVAVLSKELASQMEQSQQLTLEVGRLQREVSRHEAVVHSLEEEAHMREEAFTSLMLSEDSRALVQGLQAALQESRVETEEWRQKYEEVLQDAGRTVVAMQHKDGRAGDNSGDASPDMVRREEALAAEASRLESKAKLLKATEQRLEELKRSMVSQASVILQQHGGGSGDGFGGRMKENERPGKERRGAALLAAPRRYMQMMREQNGGEGFLPLKRILSCILFIRLRTALPIFLLMVSIVLIFLVTRRGAVPRETTGLKRLGA